MLKFLSLALVLSACNCAQIVSLNGLSGYHGLSGLHGLSGIHGASQYVLVNSDQYAVQQPTIIRQAIAPKIIAAPHPVVYQAPRPVVYQAPQQVVVEAPKIQTIVPRIVAPRIEESYGPPEPYTFGFQSTDEHGNSLSRSESADGNGAVKGSYSYIDAEGLTRVVDYVADAAGYRAVVRTNEPGTANANPADVQVNAEEPPSSVQQKVAAYSAQKVRIQ